MSDLVDGRFRKDTSHLENILIGKDLKKTVNKLVRFLKRFEFDAIAFRGMSGAIIGSAVAARMNKHLIVIRKNTTDHHSHAFVNGIKTANNHVKPLRYVVIDDNFESGETLAEIATQMQSFDSRAECAVVVLYSDWYGEATIKNGTRIYPDKDDRNRAYYDSRYEGSIGVINRLWKKTPFYVLG